MAMWGAATSSLAYMGSANDNDNGSHGDTLRILDTMLFKGAKEEESRASSHQQQQHFQQHASPDVADAMSWFREDARLRSSAEYEQIAERPHALLVDAETDAAELLQITPVVKRELKLSIELPSPMAKNRVRTMNSGHDTVGGDDSGDRYREGEEDRDAAVVDGSEEDPYLQLSPRSRRKRKNRDQMRQARQKEKETMQKLRDTVERLEARYIQATKEKDALTGGDGSIPDEAQRREAALRFPYMTSYTQSSSASPNTLASIPTHDISGSASSSSKYSELISAASRLKEENFRLKQTLHEKHKLRETLERHFSDFCEPSPTFVVMNDAPHPQNGIKHMDMGDSTTDDDYVPMTIEESWMLIRDTHECVHEVQRSIAKRAQEEESQGSQGFQQQQQQQQRQGSSTASATSKPNYCGWQIQYHTQDGVLLFAFEKPFYHVTALQAMEKMWTNERAMQSYRSAHDAANQTLKIVQHINDDTYVLQRRMLAPPSSVSATRATTTATDRYITTTYLRFRLKTARGYLVGQKSIDNEDTRGGGGGTSSSTTAEAEAEAECEGQMHWASKLCLWTEFIQEYTPSGHEYCVVRPSGFTNLQSGELNGRVVAEAIIHLLRWEIMTIGPVFTLSSE